MLEMSCGQLPSVILVPQLSAELLQQTRDGSQAVHYVSLTDEQLARLAANNALLAAAKGDKIQDNQVIDFLTLNEEVQFIKTESCASPPEEGGDYPNEASSLTLEGFEHNSPLLHETSKDVALSNSIHNQESIQLPSIGAAAAGASNGEYETAEDLLLAQLQQARNSVSVTVSASTTTTEVDEDERVASEYLTDGQLYLEKSKRSEQKCEQMDCSSTNILEHSSSTTNVEEVGARNVSQGCSRNSVTTSGNQRHHQHQSDVAEVSSTTLEPISVAATIAPSTTVNLVDPVTTSAGGTVRLHSDNKIRVVSVSGANLLSTGEPVLLGNILLVPDTPTVRLQIVQEDGSAVRELSVRSLDGAGAAAGSLVSNNLLSQASISLLANGLHSASLQASHATQEFKKSARPFQCKLCSATFNRLGNYTRHQRIHTVRCEEDERFHCEECGKSFIQRCDLTRHLHVHAGTEPHRCNLCGKGYIRHSDLVTHQRFHNKEKPFGCPHCQKGFSQRGDLNRHLRSIHLQIRPLTCGHCQKKFAKEATLIRHMRTSHREMLLQSLLIKSGGDAAAISEALITGTGDICTPTTLGSQE